MGGRREQIGGVDEQREWTSASIVGRERGDRNARCKRVHEIDSLWLHHAGRSPFTLVLPIVVVPTLRCPLARTREEKRCRALCLVDAAELVAAQVHLILWPTLLASVAHGRGRSVGHHHRRCRTTVTRNWYS
eukprot:6544192-Prymnesium_polylepis.1